MKKVLENILDRTEYDSRLIILYSLNVIDYLFTLILLSGGLFVEANPILSMQINGIGGFVVKCILPFLLLLYIHLRFLSDPPKHSLAAKLLLDGIVSCYLVIDLFHIFWLSYSIVLFM